MIEKYVKMYSGCGDSFFQLPIIEALAKKYDTLYCETPFPEIYQHLGKNIKFVPPDGNYRTQGKMMRSIQDSIWTHKTQLPESILAPLPPIQPGYPRSHGWRGLNQDHVIYLHYGPDTLARWNIVRGFERQAGVSLGEKIEFNVPHFPMSGLIPTGKKIAIVKAPTNRTEWVADSRQCDPVYINEACELLKARGFYTISVADVAPGKEWFVGHPPNADLCLHRGELGFTHLVSLVEHAAIIVAGVSWAVPMSIAYKTPAFIVFGGRGGFDSPSNITDVRMDLSHYDYVLPDVFCRCTLPQHNCPKTITNFSGKLGAFIDKIDTRPTKSDTLGALPTKINTRTTKNARRTKATRTKAGVV